MLERIISGGQTGADQAGWRVAKRFAIATGGWMPLGFLTEEGSRPDFGPLYGATEMPTASYPARTFQNARESDATLWFGDVNTPGARTTIDACHKLSKSCLRVVPEQSVRPSQVVEWINENRIRILNVAGNRESKAPGIGERVERFLSDVLIRLGHSLPDRS